jgi:hypothetical protein
VLGGQAPAQDAPEHEDPDEEADRQQHLPQAGEVEVLEPLRPNQFEAASWRTPCTPR